VTPIGAPGETIGPPSRRDPMIRLLIATGIQLLANAVGLLVAAAVLDDMEVSGTAFLVAVVVFTLVYAIAQPFFTQMALSRVPALRGGVALVATLTGLVVTAALSDGLSISGLTTWFLATVIVWLIALVGVLLLPLVIVKKSVQDGSRGRRRG
jgi:putative membrane protein